MKSSVLLLAAVLLVPSLASANAPASVQLTQPEITLAQLINAYRQANGLPVVPLSASLSKVAQTHAWDSVQNPPTAPCNMHGWSNKGGWTGFCYTGTDGTYMWSKPRELTTYTGNGFEISAMGGSPISPQVALQGWQNSQPHNDVILNKGPWTAPWKAMGIGMNAGVAHVWFGNDADPAGTPLPGALNPEPVVATDRYYRLKNLRTEADGKCLEGNQVVQGATLNGAAFMSTCSGANGQAFRFIAIGNGYYRMTNRFLEQQSKCLEGNQYPAGYLGGASFMDNCQNVTGQFWKVIAQGGHAYMQMTTAFREGAKECFTGNPVGASYPLGGSAYMSSCQNLASQLWRLEAF